MNTLSKIRDYVIISFIPRNEIEKVQINKTCGKHNFKAKYCGFDESRAVIGRKNRLVSPSAGASGSWGQPPKPPESAKVS